MSKATGKRRREARARLSHYPVRENADEVCWLCGRALGFDQATFYDADGLARLYCLDCFGKGISDAKR